MTNIFVFGSTIVIYEDYLARVNPLSIDFEYVTVDFGEADLPFFGIAFHSGFEEC